MANVKRQAAACHKSMKIRLFNLSLTFEKLFDICRGEQECRSDESTRLLTLWPGFDFQTRRHMWVDFRDLTIEQRRRVQKHHKTKGLMNKNKGSARPARAFCI